MCLGFDTSNYTTSAAVFDGRVGVNHGRLLTVQEGSLGLRQSEAVFQHVKRLHLMTEALRAEGAMGEIRAVGASKKDVSRVFNAETLIVGLGAGVLGIVVTLLLNIPINAAIHAVTGLTELSAALPPVGGAILVAISAILTILAGLIPARLAAKKDPV